MSGGFPYFFQFKPEFGNKVHRASLAAQLVKNPPAMRETWLPFLGWEDPLEKGKATHSSILAWRTPSLYSLWGHKESDTTGPLSLSLRRTFVPSEPLGSLTRETLLDSHNLTGGKRDPGKEMPCPRSWQLKCRTGSLCCSFGNPSL